MAILKLLIANCILVVLIALLSKNVDARGGGRGAGRGGFRGRGAIHRGGGGYGSYSYIPSQESDKPKVYEAPSTSDADPSIYGNTFKDNGPPEDSYLYNHYFRDWDTDDFLINSLFYGAGMEEINPDEAKKYYKSIGFEEFYRKWNDEKDKEWRETTRAPYFDNKLPGDQKIFPASAVVGAATAFGVVSLLPLDIPAGKPLMYCGTTDLIQSLIRINNIDTYVCRNNTIFKLTCNSDFKSDNKDKCEIKQMQCDLKDGITREIFCSSGTLFSSISIFCNSTTTINKNRSNKQTIVKCYEGQLPISQTSFIPTTPAIVPTELSTTPKTLSFGANVHVLLLKLMGKSEVLEPVLETYPSTGSNAWHPEALTFPPETTTEKPKPTTTRVPYVWMEIVNDNITGDTTFRPINKQLNEIPFYIPSNWYKVYTTSTDPYVETTTKPMTTTEIPYVWKTKGAATDDRGENLLETVPKSMVEVAELFNYYPSNWVKVFKKPKKHQKIKTTTPNP